MPCARLNASTSPMPPNSLKLTQVSVEKEYATHRLSSPIIEKKAIQDVIREAFESLSIKAEKAGIDFSFKKGCEKPMAVYADKEKIQQVVYNLIDNAIKYGALAREEGAVRVTWDIVDGTLRVLWREPGAQPRERRW